MNSPWICGIQEQQPLKKIYLRLDTQYAVPLSEISQKNNNWSSIFLENTNEILFNFNREIRNVVRAEISRISIPDDMLPMKYYLPDIKDSVTDNYTINGQTVNKAGDMPFSLSPVSYLGAYTGNGLASWGMSSFMNVPSAEATLNFAYGDLMVGQTSGATGKFLYFSNDKLFFRPTIPSVTGDWNVFRCGETVDITYTANSITDTVLVSSEPFLSDDDCTRMATIALEQNGLTYVPSTGASFNPMVYNGRIVGDSKRLYSDGYDQKKTLTSWVFPTAGGNAMFSTNGVITPVGGVPVSPATYGLQNWYRTNDRIYLARTGNSVIEGVHKIQQYHENTNSFTLGLPTTSAMTNNCSIDPCGVLAGKFYQEENIKGGVQNLWKRITMDAKDTKIIFSMPELGPFYSPIVNVKNSRKNLVPNFTTCELINTIGDFTVYNNYVNQDFLFFRDYNIPITISRLTMQCFTSDLIPIILSDVLQAGTNSSRNISIDITLYVQEGPKLT